MGVGVAVGAAGGVAVGVGVWANAINPHDQMVAARTIILKGEFTLLSLLFRLRGAGASDHDAPPFTSLQPHSYHPRHYATSHRAFDPAFCFCAARSRADGPHPR